MKLKGVWEPKYNTEVLKPLLYVTIAVMHSWLKTFCQRTACMPESFTHSNLSKNDLKEEEEED